MSNNSEENATPVVDIKYAIEPFLEKMGALTQDFNNAHREVLNANEAVTKFEKAAEAAEEEARDTSVQIRDFYRKGGNTKEAVKLKAKQRSEFENAEIMRALKADADVALSRTKLNVHKIAEELRDCRNCALNAIQEYLEKHLAEILPKEVWSYIDIVTFRAEDGSIVEYSHRPDIHTPRDFAQRAFSRLIYLADTKRDRSESVLGFLPALPDGFSAYGRLTPIQTSMLNKEVIQLEAKIGELQ